MKEKLNEDESNNTKFTTKIKTLWIPLFRKKSHIQKILVDFGSSRCEVIAYKA